MDITLETICARMGVQQYEKCVDKRNKTVCKIQKEKE